jgi:phosphoglycerate kinase
MDALRALPEGFAVEGKVVLLRLDLNVPLQDGSVDEEDVDRLRAAAPIVRELSGRGAKVVIATHLGEPEGVDPALSLQPVAKAFAALLGRPIAWLPGDPVAAHDALRASVNALSSGDIACLENLRFNVGEVANDPTFARALTDLAEVYVNDAFAVCHRAHASVVGVPALLPSFAGPLLRREVAVLEGVLRSPRRPLVGMLGGAKLATKLPVLRHMLELCDQVLVGGGMANALLAARGYGMGASRPHAEELALAKEVARHPRLVLPVDVVVGGGSAEPCAVMPEAVAGDEHAYDVGPLTLDAFGRALAGAAMVVWNGPLGYFEQPPFGAGTAHIAKLLDARAAAGCEVVVGGGETLAALRHVGAGTAYAHRSTGGGAMLSLLAGEQLPGVEALREGGP